MIVHGGVRAAGGSLEGGGEDSMNGCFVSMIANG